MQQQPHLLPRKLPRQARSIVTVDAILQATIQVLTREDGGSASTTRIALRAGVSVGTLYQYFPHQDALRYAALHAHLDKLAAALEALCARHQGKPLAALAHYFAADYAELKIVGGPTRWALREHMADLGMEQAKAVVFTRAGVALGDLLESAPDGGYTDAQPAATALLHELHAICWAVPGQRRDAARLDALRHDVAAQVRHRLGVHQRAAARFD